MKISTKLKPIMSLMGLLLVFNVFSQIDRNVPPPPPPPPTVDTEEIFKVAEEMPRFPGCEQMRAPEAEINKCAQQKMLEYVYNNVEYPMIAKKKKIEGTTVVNFVIDKSGQVKDAKMLRDVDSHFSETVLKMVEGMPKWIPGRQRGKNVSVSYTLPVKFKLEKESGQAQDDDGKGDENGTGIKGNSAKNVISKKNNRHSKVSPVKRKTQINPKQKEDPASELPPPPPPPKRKSKSILDKNDRNTDDEPVFEDMSVEEETELKDVPPPPPQLEEDTEEVFKMVEVMPRFPGCEKMNGDNRMKKKCSDEKLLQYIYKNLKYPAEARKNGVEGTAIITFVVATDGSIENIKISRDPGAGIGMAAKNVIESMNSMKRKWTPGKQRGEAVRVLYTMPIKFRLESDKKVKRKKSKN